MRQDRAHWYGGAAVRGDPARTGGMRGGAGPFRPSPIPVHSPARGSRPARLRWSWLPALAFLVFLGGSGAAAHAAPEPMIEAIQRALVERGFEPGKIDGAMGSRTRDALRAFQRSIGLPDTGRIDDATLAALGLKVAGRTPPEADNGESPAGMPPEPETPSADPEAVPSTGTSAAEPHRVEPVRKPDAEPTLSFAALGWHPPQTGEEALTRFTALGAPPEFKPGTGSLFVPKTELVFVLKAGERVPGFDCDPGAAELSIEFVFGPDGPVIFDPVSGGGILSDGDRHRAGGRPHPGDAAGGLGGRAVPARDGSHHERGTGVRQVGRFGTPSTNAPPNAAGHSRYSLPVAGRVRATRPPVSSIRGRGRRPVAVARTRGSGRLQRPLQNPR